MLLGIAAVITTSVIGIAVAFLLMRYEFPYRNLFSYLTMLPMILPPLVGVLGFVFILGRAGTVNVILQDWFGLEKPINFMYGMQGVLLVETLHLFPMMTLSILDALAKVDPSLEEAAQGVGAKGWRRFRDITLPLMTPGYISGALLVFIWTFADFITPLVVGVQDLLAAQAYLNIVQFVDRRLFRMGIVISALLVILAVIFVIAARQYVAIKDYSSLGYSKIERRQLGPVKRWLAVGALSTLMFICFIPQLGVVARRVRARLVADAVPDAVHARVLRAGQHRHAEVHRQFVPVLGARRRAVPRRRRADGVDPRPDARRPAAIRWTR